MWSCAICNAESTSPERPSWCSSCWGLGTYVRPVRRPVAELLAQAAQPLSAADLCRQRWALSSCEATGLSWAPGAVFMLYGPPGGRKTTLACLVAAQTAPIVLVSAEMAAGPALAGLLHHAGLSRRTDCSILRQADASALADAANAGAAIILDSIQLVLLQPGDARALADAGATMVLIVAQIRKDGLFRGQSGWLHEADIALHVVDGAWTCVKSRFEAPGASGPVSRPRTPHHTDEPGGHHVGR